MLSKFMFAFLNSFLNDETPVQKCVDGNEMCLNNNKISEMNENDEMEGVACVTRTFHCLARDSVWKMETNAKMFVAPEIFLG